MTLDLRNWKLTLPTGAKSKPTELVGAALATYQGDPFHSGPDGGTVFRAPVNGVTTSGSGYPRSELRELNVDGSLASWSSTDGRAHSITVTEAFTALPLGKPHCVGLQIHDAANDVTVFRLEGTKLYVTSGDDTHFHLVTDTYALGTRFEARYVVQAGRIDAYFNGRLEVGIPAPKLTGAYFKVGCYTQANCTNSTPCSAANFGEVTVYDVKVEHAATPTPQPVPAVTPTIMIIRHGEKPASKDDHTLSPRGQQRALAIRDRGLFTVPRVDLYRPTYAFASKGQTTSMRMLQTAQPTAEALHLPIDTSLDTENAVDATAKLLVKQARAGQVVLAVLEHSAIPATLKAVAKLLGCKDKIPTSHADDDYATGYLFATGKFSAFQESVLPGDPGYAPPPVVLPPVTEPQPPPVVAPAPDPPPATPPVPAVPDWWAAFIGWLRRLFA